MLVKDDNDYMTITRRKVGKHRLRNSIKLKLNVKFAANALQTAAKTAKNNSTKRAQKRYPKRGNTIKVTPRVEIREREEGEVAERPF